MPTRKLKRKTSVECQYVALSKELRFNLEERAHKDLELGSDPKSSQNSCKPENKWKESDGDIERNAALIYKRFHKSKCIQVESWELGSVGIGESKGIALDDERESTTENNTIRGTKHESEIENEEVSKAKGMG